MRRPQSFAAGADAFVSVHAVFDSERNTRNVLVKRTGADKILEAIPYFIKADYDRRALSQIFTQTFFRVLGQARTVLE
jgi:hypothetical protein